LIAAKADDDEGVRRRRDAKRWNERLKLAAGALNALGASSFLALVIVPVLGIGKWQGAEVFYGLIVAITCHLFGQSALVFWKPEE
jgi:hypothetical protein